MPKHLEHGTPSEWLQFAYGDLALAQADHLPLVQRELLCFHAQQAAEKSLKAILLAFNLPFPRTHNLRILLDLLPQTITIPDRIAQTARLTEYATTSRYPGFPEPVRADEYHQAVEDAKQVVSWAEIVISTREKSDAE